jgi:hypothetical protein
LTFAHAKLPSDHEWVGNPHALNVSARWVLLTFALGGKVEMAI